MLCQVNGEKTKATLNPIQVLQIIIVIIHLLRTNLNVIIVGFMSQSLSIHGISTHMSPIIVNDYQALTRQGNIFRR